MAPPSKLADPRVKSAGKDSLVVKLKCDRKKLSLLLSIPLVKDEPPESQESPTRLTTVPAAAAANGENGTDSGPATPGGAATPLSTAMGPPSEVSKKKGVKRTAAVVNGASNPTDAKPRKPAPKKKKVEDGVDSGPNPGKPGGSGQRLGPKANQGAINAGLRALDRGGKPCRKWTKGGFTVKSFTGVVWEIPRWTAPQKVAAESTTEDSAAASASSSTKENKENIQQENVQEDLSNNSNVGGDVEMHSIPSFEASSPALVPIATAS